MPPAGTPASQIPREGAGLAGDDGRWKVGHSTWVVKEWRSKRALSWKNDSVEKSMTRYWLAPSKPETLDMWLATRFRTAQLAMGVR